MKKYYAFSLFMMFLTIFFSQNINPKLVKNVKKHRPSCKIEISGYLTKY